MAEVGGGALTDYVDIISDILARLPVKSLMRFRCVSKPWRALIADPFFAKKHFRYAETHDDVHSTYRLLLLNHFESFNHFESLDFEALNNLDDSVVDGDGQFTTSTELDFPVRIPDTSFPNIVIFGSCNGLVCVFVKQSATVIWNPCTRDHIVLPSPPNPHGHSLYGFGYDPTSEDYKVVYGSRFDKQVEIHVFALKTGSWRSVPNQIRVACFHGRGKLMNGALHWIDNSPSSTRLTISFDLAEEKFDDIVPFLVPRHPGYYLWDILVYRNNSLYILQRKSCIPSLCTVWIMKEYGVKESWTRVTEFSIGTCREDTFTPLCILENGAVLMHMSTYTSKAWNDMDLSTELVLVNQNTSKTICETDSTHLMCGHAIYRETLVSPVTASIAGIQY